MKKRNKIITVVASTALTFGVLFATIGDRHFNKCNKHYEMHQCQQSKINSENTTNN